MKIRPPPGQVDAEESRNPGEGAAGVLNKLAYMDEARMRRQGLTLSFRILANLFHEG